jgi:hypothetical protein
MIKVSSRGLGKRFLIGTNVYRDSVVNQAATKGLAAGATKYYDAVAPARAGLSLKFSMREHRSLRGLIDT